MKYQVGDLVFIKHIETYGLILQSSCSKNRYGEEIYTYLTFCQKDGKQYYFYEDEIECEVIK